MDNCDAEKKSCGRCRGVSQATGFSLQSSGGRPSKRNRSRRSDLCFIDPYPTRMSKAEHGHNKIRRHVHFAHIQSPKSLYFGAKELFPTQLTSAKAGLSSS